MIVKTLKKLFQDTRAFGFMFLISFSIYALITPSFARTPIELFLTLSTSVITDYVIRRYLHHDKSFPVSALVSHFGIFLMCDTPFLYIYPLLTFISIISKHLIKFENKHIFNPNNLALVIGVLFFESKTTIVSGRWGGYWPITLIILTLGSFIVFRVKKNPIVLSFILTFIIFSFVRSKIFNSHLTWELLPLSGPAFVLFAFYMLTDPKTTPEPALEQVIFGFLVGLVDFIFRYYQNKYSLIISLFIICGIYNVLREIFKTLCELLSKTSKNIN